VTCFQIKRIIETGIGEKVQLKPTKAGRRLLLKRE
jgi:uncharacterized protein Veg